jgi:hypothetical protein
MKIKVYSLTDVYWILTACLGVCSGQNDFSRRWCGRSARYYSVFLATGFQPSVNVYLALATRTGMLADQWEHSTCPMTQFDGECLRSISHQLFDLGRIQCIASLPRSRTRSKAA